MKSWRSFNLSIIVIFFLMLSSMLQFFFVAPQSRARRALTTWHRGTRDTSEKKSWKQKPRGWICFLLAGFSTHRTDDDNDIILLSIYYCIIYNYLFIFFGRMTTTVIAIGHRKLIGYHFVRSDLVGWRIDPDELNASQPDGVIMLIETKLVLSWKNISRGIHVVWFFFMWKANG